MLGPPLGNMLVVFVQVKRGIQTQIDIPKLDIAHDRLENPFVISHARKIPSVVGDLVTL